jgi:hypothetical protein
MQVSGNRNIPYLVREVHQIRQKLSRVVHWRQIGLLYGELFLHHWRDDGLRKRLCIFLLYEHFDIGTVHVGRGGVVLFVFVKDDSIRRSIVHFHQLLVVRLDLFLLIVEDVGVSGLAICLYIFVGLGLANEITEPAYKLVA